MKAMRRKGGWRGLAAGLAGGLLLLLIGDRGAQTAPPSGLGIDPFEVLDLQVKNNVLIVLDTSGSMKWVTDRDDFPVGSDDPSSRMFQLKEAVRAVVAANQTKVNLGLATYNILANQKTLLRDADDDNDGNDSNGQARPDGPFIYVSADAGAANFYINHSNVNDTTTGGLTETCTNVDGFFCQIARDFSLYDGTNDGDVWRSFGNRTGGAGGAFDDPYPANCTVGAGRLTPVIPTLRSAPVNPAGSGMRCRYYLQSRLFRNGQRYTWNRATGDVTQRLTATVPIPGGCPAPPAGLVGFPTTPPICFQFEDPSLPGPPAGRISTFYYSSAAFQQLAGTSACGGGALLNQVAPCAGNNAPPILTAMDPELPVCTAAGPGCLGPGTLKGVPAAPGNATWDFGDGHLDADNILAPNMGGLRAGQSTPLAGTLQFIRTTPPASPAFPPSGAPGRQKNFAILLTDGDDTCASPAPSSDPARADRRAVLAAEQAELLYLNTADFQRWAETLVVAFTASVNPVRVNVIAQAGSGRDINQAAATPAAALLDPLTGGPAVCRAGGTCRDAFIATSTQELIDVLNAAIDQAAASAVFSATASVFDRVPEYVNRFQPRNDGTDAGADSDPMDPDTRYHPGCPPPPALCGTNNDDRFPVSLVAYRALFEASGFRGIVKAFSSTGPVQVEDPTTPGATRDWEAGQTLMDRISADAKPAASTPHTFAGMYTADAGSPIANHFQRRIFTTSGNGIAPTNTMLWPPDPLVAPTTLVAGTLDEPLFRKFDNSPLTVAEMQAAPFKACLGTNLAATACAASPTAQSIKETREMILAYTVGAEAVRNGAGEPIRNAAGQILYQARSWILSESTLGQPAVVAPPLQTVADNHAQEYLHYRDGPRRGGVTVATPNPIDEGFGLRNPDDDGSSASNNDLKPVMTVLYVPANDMLHAFRAGANCGGIPTPPAIPNCVEQGGEELWGYVPYDLLFKLKDRLKSQTRVDHTFMMASSLRFADVFSPGTFQGRDNITYSGRWRKILLAGRGIGGKYYSALDITAPGPFTRTALATNLPRVLWNRGNPDTDNGLPTPTGRPNDTPGDLRDYADMGQTWSTPLISKVDPDRNSGREYVVYVGSGYGVDYNPATRGYVEPVPAQPNQGQRFYTLDPLTGSILSSFPVGSVPGAPPAVKNALLANPVHFAAPLLSSFRPHPAAVPIESVFVGELHGRMWKVDTNDSATPILYYDAGPVQPIATAAALLRNDVDKPWVFFETGYDQRVFPGALFKAFGVRDNGASPGTLTPGFPIDFPAVTAERPYRGTLQPVTTLSGTGGRIFFAGTRFNPITGSSCVSSFDTLVFNVRVQGVATTGVTSTEYENVRAVGLPQPPTGIGLIDQGTPPLAGGEPPTPLPPDRVPDPGAGSGGNVVTSLTLRSNSPICREN